MELVKNDYDHNFVKYLVIILMRYKRIAIPAKPPFLSIDFVSI